MVNVKSVDPLPQTKQRPPLPVFLKGVPTIVLTGSDGQYRVYLGSQAFAWLNGGESQSGQPGGQNQQGLAVTSNIDSTGLQTFQSQEMTGIASNYSLLDGSSLGGELTPYGQDQSIYTPIETNQKITASQVGSMDYRAPQIERGNAPPPPQSAPRGGGVGFIGSGNYNTTGIQFQPQQQNVNFAIDIKDPSKARVGADFERLIQERNAERSQMQVRRI